MIRAAYLLVSTALLAATTALGAAPEAAAPDVAASDMAGRETSEHGDVEIARIMRARDGLFYLTLRVNDRPVRFLVDTGASMAVLRKADAARAGVAIDRAAASVMRTAGGLRSYRWGVADRLALHRGSEADVEYGPVEVAVADLGLNASLLGQDALSRLGTVTIRGDVMTVSVPAGAAGSGVRGTG